MCHVKTWRNHENTTQSGPYSSCSAFIIRLVCGGYDVPNLEPQYYPKQTGKARFCASPTENRSPCHKYATGAEHLICNYNVCSVSSLYSLFTTYSISWDHGFWIIFCVQQGLPWRSTQVTRKPLKTLVLESTYLANLASSYNPPEWRCAHMSWTEAAPSRHPEDVHPAIQHLLHLASVCSSSISTVWVLTENRALFFC